MKEIKNSISIIHPSRCRPDLAFYIAEKWLNLSSKEYPIEYYLSIDTTDPTKEKYISYFSQKKAIKIVQNDNKSAIEAINNAAKLTKNNLIVVVSDDFDCFQDWDKWLFGYLQEYEDYIVKTKDGIQTHLITLPIMDRKYYNRFGYIYYPEYLHMFCDTEMTDVGHILGRVIDLQDPNYQFTHRHPVAGLMQRDEIHEKNDATWNQGEELYKLRKSHNFYL